MTTQTIATVSHTAPRVQTHNSNHSPFIIGGFGILFTIVLLLAASRN